MTGTPGEQKATAYVARAFESFGLKPFLAEDYFHPFEFTAGVDLGEKNKLTLTVGGEKMELKVNEDWKPLSFSQLGEIKAEEIVFAGYGIEIPEGQVGADGKKSAMYSSYYHLAVKDKWVCLLYTSPSPRD